MAEFTEVMRQVKRMCDATVSARCHECTLWRPETESCSLYGDDDGVDYADMERRVMAWAAEHPEQRYPSWHEAWQSLFPGADDPCPGKLFGEDCPEGMQCLECRERPMSKKVAEKLGIEPIDKSCETCKYTDKVCDEEPCVRCRNTQPYRSERWAEMPDLWE